MCSHIYQAETINIINKVGATTQIIKSFLLEKNKKLSRVVLYRYIDGVPLGHALEQHSITREEAVGKILNIVEQLNQGKIYLILRDKNDFLLTPEGVLKLTDWNALVDVKQATTEAIQGYIPFKKRCIEDFIGCSTEYNMGKK